MTTISVTAATTFVGALENAFKSAVSGFEGFGSDIKSDIGAATVDVGIIANGVLAAFTASGNGEAAVLAPFINGALGLVSGLEQAFGFTAAPTGSTTAPVTTPTTQPNTTQPVVPAAPTAPSTGSDGLGDSDADTGAL